MIGHLLVDTQVADELSVRGTRSNGGANQTFPESHQTFPASHQTFPASPCSLFGIKVAQLTYRTELLASINVSHQFTCRNNEHVALCMNGN
jgi:hypothetical protein